MANRAGSGRSEIAVFPALSETPMDAVLAAADAMAPWIDSQTAPSVIDELMRPTPDEWLETVVVSNFVNNARNDGPQCIARMSA